MKILIVGKFYEDSFALHIADTLEALGHSAVRYQFGKRVILGRRGPVRQATRTLSQAMKELYSRTDPGIRSSTTKLLKVVDESSPDLTLVCHDFLYPDQVAAVRTMTKSPIALWFPDSIGQFGRSMFLNSRYDAVFFKDPYIVDVLTRELRAPAYYLPECCNPSLHRPVALNQRDVAKYGCDIATAGNLYPGRVAFFSQLTAYHVNIWGNPASRWIDTHSLGAMMRNEYVAGTEKAKAFLGAKVLLNNLHPAEIWGANARAFEACAIGAFQFISWRPQLERLFEDGREFVTFRDTDQLLSKLNYFLHQPEERASIAKQGRLRAIREHTYEHRLRLLLATIGGEARGFGAED